MHEVTKLDFRRILVWSLKSQDLHLTQEIFRRLKPSWKSDWSWPKRWYWWRRTVLEVWTVAFILALIRLSSTELHWKPDLPDSKAKPLPLNLFVALWVTNDKSLSWRFRININIDGLSYGLNIYFIKVVINIARHKRGNAIDFKFGCGIIELLVLINIAFIITRSLKVPVCDPSAPI